MDFKLFGSILLIVGTSIGAGMLGLPIATASLGFFGSVALLFLCWFIMTAGALLILEANLWLPQNNNLISMAKLTIGPLGQLIAWIAYLLLLYSLLCAYIAGGSGLFHNLLTTAGIPLPISACSILFTVIFGTVVYMGIRSVDYVNRVLMLLKFGAFFTVILLLMPFISSEHISQGHWLNITSATAITVTITSFGFATIIPSLRVYFHGDVKKLRQAILMGTTIALICYIFWDAAIMGIIPITGTHGLLAILNSNNSTSDLVNILSTSAGKTSITFFVKFFTSICVLTSFLGVALSLTDFLADGLQIEKQGKGNWIIYPLTFLPSLIIALFFPNIFIKALSYAGIYSIILLILLPAWMVFNGRYKRNIAKGYAVSGGRLFLIGLIIFSIVLIIKGLTSN